MDDKFFIDIVNTGIAIFRIGEKKFQQNIQKILEDTNSLVKVGEEEQSGQAIQIREITQKPFVICESWQKERMIIIVIFCIVLSLRFMK